MFTFIDLDAVSYIMGHPASGIVICTCVVCIVITMNTYITGLDLGGGGGPGGHMQDPPPPNSDFIQAWRIEKHESGNSFLGGGGIRQSRNLAWGKLHLL